MGVRVPSASLDHPKKWGHNGGMSRQKFKTQYPGVRYYEHPNRKQRSGQPDRFFSIRYKIDGRTVEETLGWATDKWSAEKAHAVLAEIKANRRTGKGPQTLAEMREAAAKEREAAARKAAIAALANMTLGDFFDNYYIPEAQRTKQSWLIDQQRFEKLYREPLGSLPMNEITKEHVQPLLDGLVKSGAAPSTVKQYRSILSHAFTLASRTRIEGQAVFTGASPVSEVKILPVKNDRERFLTGEEAEALIEEAKKHTFRDLHDCIVLSLNTGLRLGELKRLHWPDVDMAHRMLTVRDEAMRKPGGKVPLNDAAMAIFRERRALCEKADQGLVFPPIVGGATRTNLSHSFKFLVDKLGLNDGIAPDDRARRIVFHSLRHTFASWLAINGEDIYRINKLMRHKTITMTMRYAHLIPDATRNAVHNLKPPTINP